MKLSKLGIELRAPECEGGRSELIAALARIVVRICSTPSASAQPDRPNQPAADDRVQYDADERTSSGAHETE